MELGLVAIALGDISWLFLAFAAGFLAKAFGLPPLVGFLCVGFLLKSQGIASSDGLNKLADLGITLLLFTVGLKLNLRTLMRPQVWAVSTLHCLLIVALFTSAILMLATLGVSFFC